MDFDLVKTDHCVEPHDRRRRTGGHSTPGLRRIVCRRTSMSSRAAPYLGTTMCIGNESSSGAGGSPLGATRGTSVRGSPPTHPPHQRRSHRLRHNDGLLGPPNPTSHARRCHQDSLEEPKAEARPPRANGIRPDTGRPRAHGRAQGRHRQRRRIVAGLFFGLIFTEEAAAPATAPRRHLRERRRPTSGRGFAPSGREGWPSRGTSIRAAGKRDRV